jgi:hypothetical protein
MRYSRAKQSRAIVLYQDQRSLLVRVLPANSPVMLGSR